MLPCADPGYNQFAKINQWGWEFVTAKIFILLFEHLKQDTELIIIDPEKDRFGEKS
jgi:hypothetical protein